MADETRVPISRPDIRDEDIDAVAAVLRSGVLANGPEAAALETEFARVCGAEYAVAVSSGTAALVLAGQALGLGKGDHVLVPGFTFAASANAFLYLGCSVEAVDVDAETFNLDATRLEEALGRRPAAVVVVDLYGSTRGTDEAIEVARRAGARVIEDAAQAHGALDASASPLGGRSDVTTFSLYATKNMAAGEGGILVTNDAAVDSGVRRLRNHGGVETYRHEVIGLNHRLDEMAAALARRQLARLEPSTKARREHAAQIARWCRDAWGDAVAVPREAFETAPLTHVFHQFTVRFSDGSVRDAVARFLDERGIDSRVFYPYAIADLPGVGASDTPVAHSLVGQVLSLPVHPTLGEAELERLHEAIAASARVLRQV